LESHINAVEAVHEEVKEENEREVDSNSDSLSGESSPSMKTPTPKVKIEDLSDDGDSDFNSSVTNTEEGDESYDLSPTMNTNNNRTRVSNPFTPGQVSHESQHEDSELSMPFSRRLQNIREQLLKQVERNRLL